TVPFALASPSAGAVTRVSVESPLRAQEQEEQRREFEALWGGRDMATESGEDASEDTCIICLTQPRECVLLCCGHVCCCFGCYEALPSHTCPICRSPIDRVVPLYQA
uniref:RING-type domain-containing protein n=1 Tax=Chelydra serpentina TaxID=8475 RepID=A0A8C3SF29_CHESE